MPNQIREFHRAPTLDRAVELLQRADRSAAPLVSGPRPPDAVFPVVDAVIDLQGLGLEAISVESQAIRIGALAPLQALVESASLSAVADGIVNKAAYLSAHFGLRNLATLGGAINGAIGEKAGPPEVTLALLALGATVEVAGASVERLPLVDYDPASTLLTAVIVPRADQVYGALARVARSPLDQAIVAAFAVVSDATARVAVAGAGPEPIVVQAAMDAVPESIIAQLVSEVAANTSPAGDYRGSADYRRAMAEVLARRALTEAFANRADS